MRTAEWVQTVLAEDAAKLAELTAELKRLTLDELLSTMLKLPEGELPPIKGFYGIQVYSTGAIFLTPPMYPHQARIPVTKDVRHPVVIEQFRERAPAYVLWTARRNKGACRDMAQRVDDLRAFIALLDIYTANDTEEKPFLALTSST